MWNNKENNAYFHSIQGTDFSSDVAAILDVCQQTSELW